MARRRKLVYKNRRKRKIYFSLLLACILMIGVGFSNLTANLEILGTLGLKRIPSFANDTWEELVENIESGKIQYYQVGDTREIDMGTLGTHTLRIVNKSTPSECSDPNFSQTACGFVVEFVDIIATHAMNSTDSNSGGWLSAEMNSFVNYDIYDALPTELKTIIINTPVISGHNSSSSSNIGSVDKLFLLSEIEVYGGASSVYDTLDVNQTRQLDYYANASDIRKKNGNNYSAWYLRTAVSSNDTGFLSVDSTGTMDTTVGASTALGVAPAFRLGLGTDMLRLQTNSSSYTFGKSISRDSFESITTVNHITVPGNAIDSWDASDNQSGNVMAWYLDEDNDSKYELYLGQVDGVIANTYSNYAFSRFEKLDSIDVTYLDVSNVINMSEMFSSAGRDSTVFTLDLGDNFDTSNVTDMSWMFDYAGSGDPNFTLDLGDKFDTSNVTNMYGMCGYLGLYSTTISTLDLGDNFDTSNVTNMSFMFTGVGASVSGTFTLDLGDNFDTSNVTNMSWMFNDFCSGSSACILDLGDKFDTSNVVDMSYMFVFVGFQSTNFTLDLGDKFDTSNVTTMKRMFYSTCQLSSVCVLDLGNNFDTSKVTNMEGMFMYAGGLTSTSFTLNLGDKFDTSNVTNMKQMFYSTGKSDGNFTLDLGPDFVFTNVTEYADIFKYWKTTQKIYVKSATERSWIVTNSGNSNLTNSNVLIRS